jgi:hypothetical protein
MKSEGALDPRMLPHPKPEPLQFPFRQLVRLSVEHRRHLGLNEVLCAPTAGPPAPMRAVGVRSQATR